MGWYDAFSGDVARVNTSRVTTDTGSGASAFGDAFASFGKSLYSKEIDKEKSAVLDLQKQNEQNKLDTFNTQQTADKNSKEYLSTASDNNSLEEFNQIANSTTKDGKKYLTGSFEDKQKVVQMFKDREKEKQIISDNADNWVQKEDNNDYIADAWGATSRKEFEKNNILDDTNSVDSPTMEKVNAIFTAREKAEANKIKERLDNNVSKTKNALYGVQKNVANENLKTLKKTNTANDFSDAFGKYTASINGTENLQTLKDNYNNGGGFDDISTNEIENLNTKIALSEKADENKKIKTQIKVDDAFGKYTASINGTENLQTLKDNYNNGGGFDNISKDEIENLNTKIALSAKADANKSNEISKLNSVKKDLKQQQALSKQEQKLFKVEQELIKKSTVKSVDGARDIISISKYLRAKEALNKDKYGEAVVDETTKPKLDFLETKIIPLMNNGKDLTQAYNIASEEWIKKQDEVEKDKYLKSDPLDGKSTPPQKKQEVDDFLGFID